MKINKLIYVMLVISFASANGQNVTKTGTTAAPFLKIDVGARAFAMGGSFVSVANDVTAMHWNPAGIARLEESETVFSTSNWIADISYNYAGVALQLGRFGYIGANACYVSMDEMERTTINFPEGTDEMFGANMLALGMTYAQNLTDRFSIGFTVKYIREQIYHSSANGLAIDVGTIFTTKLNGMNIGMSISNYGTKMQIGGRDLLTQVDVDPSVYGNNPNINAKLVTDKYDLPLLFRVGVSMDLLKGLGKSNLIASVDALHPNDDVEYLNIGGEYIFNHFFALRGGYKTLFARDSEEGLSFGVGLKSAIVGSTILHFDYGYRDFGRLNDVQTFTIRLSF